MKTVLGILSIVLVLLITPNFSSARPKTIGEYTTKEVFNITYYSEEKLMKKLNESDSKELTNESKAGMYITFSGPVFVYDIRDIKRIESYYILIYMDQFGSVYNITYMKQDRYETENFVKTFIYTDYFVYSDKNIWNRNIDYWIVYKENGNTKIIDNLTSSLEIRQEVIDTFKEMMNIK